MQSVSLKDIAALFDGHVDCLSGPEGLQPVRYRAADVPFIDPGVIKGANFPSGVRLRLRTDSRIVRIEVSQKHAQIPGREWWSPDYELFIDGKPYRKVAPVGGARIFVGGVTEGDPRGVLTLDGLPKGDKHIELWLPPAAMVAFLGLQIDDGARWAPWPDARWRVLFHGSSITQATDANAGTLTWPAVASLEANIRHLNLGWSGSCLISGFAARILRDEPADAIALELGTNIWENGLLKERTFVDSTQSMLSIIREKHPQTPIAVSSPISLKAGDDASNDGGLSMRRTRELVEAAVTARVAAGDKNIFYLAGTLLSGPDDLDNLPDGVHPNPLGNRLMGERFFAHMLAPGKPLAPR